MVTINAIAWLKYALYLIAVVAKFTGMLHIKRRGIPMSNRNDLPVKKEGATCCELQDMAYSQSGISGNPALDQEDQPR